MRRTRTARGVALASAALVVVLASGTPGAAQGRVVPRDIRAAAEIGLKGLLEVDAGRGLDRLGFRDQAEAAGARIGSGFQVFTVPPDQLIGNGSADLTALAAPTTQWLFLVVNGTAPKAVLTVDRVNGVWTAVSIGGANLSEDLSALMARWPASAYQHRFIRSQQAAAEVMEISGGGRVLGAVPFRSARVSLRAGGRFDANDLWSTSEVTDRMRPAVKAAMGRGK